MKTASATSSSQSHSLIIPFMPLCFPIAHDFIAFIAIVLIWHNLSVFPLSLTECAMYTMRAFIYLNFFMFVRFVMHKHLSKGIFI